MWENKSGHKNQSSIRDGGDEIRPLIVYFRLTCLERCAHLKISASLPMYGGISVRESLLWYHALEIKTQYQ